MRISPMIWICCKVRHRKAFGSISSKKNPYEFQDLVAALLRAMGYYTPFIAPKGKDGGVDIIAYRDRSARPPRS